MMNPSFSGAESLYSETGLDDNDITKHMFRSSGLFLTQQRTEGSVSLQSYSGSTQNTQVSNAIQVPFQMLPSPNRMIRYTNSMPQLQVPKIWESRKRMGRKGQEGETKYEPKQSRCLDSLRYSGHNSIQRGEILSCDDPATDVKEKKNIRQEYSSGVRKGPDNKVRRLTKNVSQPSNLTRPNVAIQHTISSTDCHNLNNGSLLETGNQSMKVKDAVSKTAKPSDKPGRQRYGLLSRRLEAAR